ncbi:hypothetical protein B0H10DRAFT_1953988 [Mycena sp. CBHHK59/15]|nr:hypothetical protein B0H10DRAFT_1953988 [Mycena sp. CBHHK59/15]
MTLRLRRPPFASCVLSEKAITNFGIFGEPGTSSYDDRFPATDVFSPVVADNPCWSLPPPFTSGARVELPESFLAKSCICFSSLLLSGGFSDYFPRFRVHKPAFRHRQREPKWGLLITGKRYLYILFSSANNTVLRHRFGCERPRSSRARCEMQRSRVSVLLCDVVGDSDRADSAIFGVPTPSSRDAVLATTATVHFRDAV